MKGDVVAGVAGILAGSGIVAGSLDLGVGGLTHPAPGSFPFLAGAALVAVSVLLLLRARVASHPASESAGDLHDPLCLVGAMVLYAALFEPAGYLLATTIVGVVILKALRLSWRRAAGASVLLAVSTYVLFARLMVELPGGVFAGFR